MNSGVPRIEGFEDLTQIGKGGFSTVYRALQPSAGRHVAVKVLSAQLDDDDTRRFERECQALGSLTGHPGICTLYSFGRTDEDHPFLVLELCNGSLGDRIRANGPLTPEATVTVLRRLAQALGHAHERGILHRDVKPENVLLTQFDQPVLGDFGIARMQDGWQTTSSLVTASLSHAAPEVLDGEPPTAASDIWSLASSGYQLLTGAAPFRRNTDESSANMLARIFRDPPPDLRPQGVPPALCDALEAAMNKAPEQRTPTMAAFADSLTPRHPASSSTVPVDRAVVQHAAPIAATAALASPTTRGRVELSQGPADPEPPRSGAWRRWLAGGAAVLLIGVGVLGVVLATRAGDDDGSGLIAFTAKSDIDGESGVWVVRPDGSDLRRVDLTVTRCLSPVATLSWDATAIVFGGDDQGCGVGVVGLDGSGRRTIDARGACHLGCDWSPGGRSVAYLRREVGEGASAFHVIVASLEEEDVEVDLGEGESVVWSADGTKIAIGTPEGTIQLHDVAAGTSRPLSAARTLYQPSFDPSGDRIVAMDEYQAYVLDLATNEVIRVCHEAEDVNSPAWSPDGTSIVFQNLVEETLKVCVLETGAIRSLPVVGRSVHDASWR